MLPLKCIPFTKKKYIYISRARSNNRCVIKKIKNYYFLFIIKIHEEVYFYTVKSNDKVYRF